MKITKQVKKDRLEAKKFVESLRPEEKQYWVLPWKERERLSGAGVVYNGFFKRIVIYYLRKYFPEKFNRFDL